MTHRWQDHEVVTAEQKGVDSIEKEGDRVEIEEYPQFQSVDTSIIGTVGDQAQVALGEDDDDDDEVSYGFVMQSTELINVRFSTIGI